MELRDFCSDDLKSLNEWLEKRGKAIKTRSELPKMGVVVRHQNALIAMGFLIQAEVIGIIDSVITNPEKDPELRNKALDMLFENLILMSKLLDFHRIIGFSVDEHTLIRSERFGFYKSDYTLMLREA